MTTKEIIQNKIFRFDDPCRLEQNLTYLRFKSKNTVFTNGCFDLVHIGHADYLSRAKDLGDTLILGLNTDDSVRRLKGPKRPLMNEGARAYLLASLHFVDMVVLFGEDTPYELIKLIKPDFLVKGKDYSPKDIAGYDIVTESGGEVVTLDLVEGFSTTKLIEKIKGLD